MTTILPITYLGNIEYYSHLIFENCLIEQHASYSKQSYANRCRILSANGPQDLSIPVIKPDQLQREIKDIKISNQTDWQKTHWRSIESAYNTSPFFEYYKDSLLEIYSRKYTYLFDWNNDLQTNILNELEYDNLDFAYSNHYIIDQKNTVNDLRDIIHPKKNNVSLHEQMKKPYYQVFKNKFDFAPNLSIIDLLFNMGNESRIYLKNWHNLRIKNK